MDNVNIVIMGKTGAGKSTVVNAILEEDIAPTGAGQAVTIENKLYSKNILLPVGKNEVKKNQYGLVAKQVNLYDTVGLEIDETITQKTLQWINYYIKQAKNNEKDNDITFVWFCVNYRCNKFEDFELKIIKKMSIEYEIPFVLVITQCLYNERSELEKQIESILPEIPIMRILAKESKTRGGTISAFGLKELLINSITKYDECKVVILQSKLESLKEDKKNKIQEITGKCNSIVDNYKQKATKIGFIPGGCIPVVHGMCLKMMWDLNKTVGIESTKGFGEEFLTNAVLGVIATPFMIVPLLSAAFAGAYIEQIGEDYTKALISVIEHSSNKDLKDNEVMAERIKQELKKRKK